MASREQAARAALRAHHERRNPPSRHLPGAALYRVSSNPDLESAFVDSVADLLLLAEACGVDGRKVARMASDHFEVETRAERGR